MRKTQDTCSRLPTSVPRNPVAPAACRRAAGRHGGGPARERQAARRALRTELAALHAPPGRCTP